MALNRRLDAVVLAGGPPDEVAALAPGAPNKAFVPVAGLTLVERTLAALRASPRTDRIVVVAPPVVHAHPALAHADEVRSDGPTMRASLRAGLAGFAPASLLLVAASDLPVLTAAAIEEFVAKALDADADLAYACVERRDHEARFPEIPHTWATLREGTFCGGGVVALRPRVLPQLERLLGRLGAARKNPLRLAAIFGPGVLGRYALRRLRIAHAQARASALLGAPVVAIRCRHPEIAVNVDRPGDVALAEAVLRTNA